MAEFAGRAVSALQTGDWYAAYLATSAWGTEADGVWLPDTWLLLSACDVVNGHTRGTVHPLNLGLQDWVDRPGDRAVLLWARGQLIRHRMSDPGGALPDLLQARQDGPDWLTELADSSIDAARRALASGEDGEPMNHHVQPAPEYAPQPAPKTPPRGVRRPDGAKPHVFDDLLDYFHKSPPLHSVI